MTNETSYYSFPSRILTNMSAFSHYNGSLSIRWNILNKELPFRSEWMYLLFRHIAYNPYEMAWSLMNMLVRKLFQFMWTTCQEMKVKMVFLFLYSVSSGTLQLPSPPQTPHPHSQMYSQCLLPAVMTRVFQLEESGSNGQC